MKFLVFFSFKCYMRHYMHNDCIFTCTLEIILNMPQDTQMHHVAIKMMILYNFLTVTHENISRFKKF